MSSVNNHLTIIKKAYVGEFKYLISVIRQAILKNQSYAIFPKKKFEYLPLLKKLREGGFIEGYESRGELLVIMLKHSYWASNHVWSRSVIAIENIHTNKYGTVTSKQMTKMRKRQGQIVSTFISSSRGGIINALNASQLKEGGIPLFKIY